jgi:hypothetical protein
VREDFNTGDWSRAGNHYYSNKAPGTTLLALPCYELLFRLERALGVDPTTFAATSVNSYLLGVAVAAFPVALAATLFLAFLLGRGWSRTDALFVASLFAYGSLLFPFATQLWGHPTAAAFLMMALIATLSRRPRPFAAGFLCAMAMLTDHLAIASLALFFAWFVFEKPRRNVLRYLAGTALPLLALAAYDAFLFGSPLRSAPGMSNPMFIDKTKLAGVFGMPSLRVAVKLLASPERGIVLYLPVLLFVIAAASSRFRAHPRRETLFAIANAAACFVLNTMFNGWDGGWSTGPRYLILAMPFCFVLMPRPSALPVWLRAMYVTAALVTVTNMIAIASVTPMTSVERNPLYGPTYHAFLTGQLQPCDNIVVRLHPVNTPAEKQVACFNIGNRFLHLDGAWTLIPLLLLMAVPWMPIRAHDAQTRTPRAVRLAEEVTR